MGTSARFLLIAATEQEQAALRSLGTYGFIRNPTGFIVGVVKQDTKDLEDFGYLMERAVLLATDLQYGLHDYLGRPVALPLSISGGNTHDGK